MTRKTNRAFASATRVAGPLLQPWARPQVRTTPPTGFSRQTGIPPVSQRCRGLIRQSVFLGHRFVTDLVLLRIQMTPPLCQAPRARAADYCALQDALQTLADALPLAAGRMFDVDFTEFSAGYRLISQADASSSACC